MEPNEPIAHWPFWAGALALAAVATLHTRFAGRALGVSGELGRALDRAPRSLAFLAALAAGGLLGGLHDGALDLQPIAAGAQALWGDGLGPFAALLGGGALVGFGTALAGGCTSGHGLIGCARLQPASLVVTAAFFGTAVAVSLALQEVLA